MNRASGKLATQWRQWLAVARAVSEAYGTHGKPESEPGTGDILQED